MPTKPGSEPYACFQIATDSEEENLKSTKPDYYGVFGHQIDGSKQIFIQRLNRNSNKIIVICASNGNHICSINSVDKSAITTYAVLDEEITLGNRTIILLTGHENGICQYYDLGTAFELRNNVNCEKQDTTINYKDLLKELFE